MEPVAFQMNRSVCRLCRSSLARPVISQWQQPFTTGPSTYKLRTHQRRWASNKGSNRADGNSIPSAGATRIPQASSAVSPAIVEVQRLSNVVLKHTSIPTEEETLRALGAIESFAQVIAGSSIEVPIVRTAPKKVEGDATSALLSLDARPTSTPIGASVETINILSTLAYNLVKHDPVFITPKILSTYVSIQTLLGCPSSLPEIFNLFATKPSPTLDGKHIAYKPLNPRAIAAAVPASLTKTALDSSILHRDLALSLNIISSTYRTPAFRRSKLFRRAAPPAAIAACTPIAAYAIASNLASMQLGLPTEDFTMLAFAGMMSYISGVGILGYVALTTSNDQMERVTWAIGMPLLERWVREEERAACERVAKAWGFTERGRWGEEVGEEWEEFRDWLGFKGMTLDKVSLLEGME